MATVLIEDAGYSADLRGYALHAHNCYEIIYLRKGRLNLQVNSRQYDISGPSLIFLSKLEHHSLQVLGDVYERFWLCISPAGAGNLIRSYALLSLLSNRPEEFCHVMDAQDFAQEADRIFTSSIAEFRSTLPYSAERQAALLSELLIMIFRKNPALFSSETSKTISVIWQIQCQLEQRYAEKFTLAELAEEYHISPSYLSHLFKRVTGYTIMEYLTMCRLSMARKLLCETELSITEIVYATGFSDCSNFSRLFKREIGCSPMEYKRVEHERA